MFFLRKWMKRGSELDDLYKFHRACEDGDVSKVQEIIERGLDNVNVRDEVGYTALHNAAEKGHVDVVKVLIQNGANVNAYYKHRGTPLHWAAYKGHVDIARMLIQNGAKVNAVGKYKWTALHCAAEKRHADVTKVLIQNGAKVNAVDEDKYTALHSAACNGLVDIAKMLIQNGADVNAVDKDEQTPLHEAALRGGGVITLQLLCFGAAIDQKALEDDKTGLLGPINDRMYLLRAGKRPETSLMSSEEREWMWNLAFSLTVQHSGARAFKAYYKILSFITFHGIFMAHGYEYGDESVWKR